MYKVIIKFEGKRNGKRKPRQIQTYPTSFCFIYINENHYTKVPCLSMLIISSLSIHSRY